MRVAAIATVLAASGVVSASPLTQGYGKPTAQCLPVEAYNTMPFNPYTLEEALNGTVKPPIKPCKTDYAPGYEPGYKPEDHQLEYSDGSYGNVEKRQGGCANPRVRVEWDSLSTAGRQSFVNAVRCLVGRPASGAYPNSRNRYEDLVALHQASTPNVHGNSKFLLWHRYYLWVFEDVLRAECGYGGTIPWFDETRYAGRFSQSSIFSGNWLGGIAIGGACVTNGQFAGMTLNVGPGRGNTRHCLARNGNGARTANTNANMVNACNARGDYASMASCSEGGAHAWGHNGIGAVMSDVFASPGDPVFWLHHGFIDRNFRRWQNANPVRSNSVNGRDAAGAPLTLSSTVASNNIRATRQIRDVINTQGGFLCYRYDY